MATGFVVLTAVGPDRVGIVDDIAGAVPASGCNIEESKMAVLGGEFAVIMLVSGPAASVEALTRSLPALGGKLGLQLECRPTHEPRVEEKGRPYLLKAVSLDTPGIVHSVTAILRRHEHQHRGPGDRDRRRSLDRRTDVPPHRAPGGGTVGFHRRASRTELAHLQQQHGRRHRR